MEANLHLYFPKHKKEKNTVPLLCTLKPNCRPVPNAKDTIPSSLANLIASGAISPTQALVALAEADDESTIALTEYESDESSYSDSDFDSDFDSDCDSEVDSAVEDEIYKIIGGVGKIELCTIAED